MENKEISTYDEFFEINETVLVGIEGIEGELGDAHEIALGLATQRTVQAHEFASVQVAARVVLAELVEYRFDHGFVQLGLST